MNRFQRKISSIKYLNVSWPDKYEELESTYKTVRSLLPEYKNKIMFLQTYEYGGPSFSKLVEKTNSLTSKINLNKYENESAYIAIKKLSEKLKNEKTQEALNKTANQLTENFTMISEAKEKLNGELKKIISDIDSLKLKTKEIDKLREDVKDLRYNLEKAMQEDKDQDKISKLKEEFNVQTNAVHEKMASIISDKGFYLCLNSFNKKIKEFHKHIGDNMIYE